MVKKELGSLILIDANKGLQAEDANRAIAKLL